MMSDVAHRYFALLRMLPRAPAGLETTEIHRRLGARGAAVTLRSIQRDLERLEASGIQIECDRRAKPFTWSWRKDADVLSLPGLTPEAAVAFKLVEEHFEHVLPRAVMVHLKPHFDQAKQALKAAGRSATFVRKFRSKPAGLPVVVPAIERRTLDAIHAALLDDKKCALMYRRASHEAATPAVVHPLGLVLKGGLGYLVCAYDEEGLRKRTLRLDRIESATLLEERSVTPPGFTLDAFLDAGELGVRVGREKIRLELHVEKQAADDIRDKRLARDQVVTPHEDGSVHVVAEVPDTMELRRHLYHYGAQLTVLAPASLRAWMMERVQEHMKKYFHDDMLDATRPVAALQ